jgi:hypothetical protein
MGRYILAAVLAALLITSVAVVTVVVWSFLSEQEDQSAIYQSCINSGRSEEFCAATAWRHPGSSAIVLRPPTCPRLTALLPSFGPYGGMR